MLDMSGLVCGKTGDKTMSHVAYILLIPFTLLGCLVGLQLKYKFGFNWLEIAINTMNAALKVTILSVNEYGMISGNVGQWKQLVGIQESPSLCTKKWI